MIDRGKAQKYVNQIMIISSQISRNIVENRIGKDHVITEERSVDITDNSAVKDGWNC